MSRLYDLDELPSYDSRFNNMRRDIFQHRVNNEDWDDDWVYSDPRLNLLKGTDENFLNFLCETLHPIVRSDDEEVEKLVCIINEELRNDGYELVQTDTLSGRPVFLARLRIQGSDHFRENANKLRKLLDSQYIDKQIKRIYGAIENDPELAIGTAKELVETICKTMLHDKGVEFNENEEFPQLVRITLKQLKLTAEDIPEQAKASKTIRVLLQNLATISNGLAELRNPYGTGHGKHAKSKGLEPRHARLAAGAASTLAVFLYETHMRQL